MSAVRVESADPAVIELLDDLRRRRVRVWSENGELRYRAPKGTVREEDLAKLSRLARQIVTLLESLPPAEASLPPLMPRQRDERAPLSYSQFKYWHAYQLDERATMRSVATATALHGQLDPVLLQRCAQQVVERHESLRTRIVTIDGAPVQVVQAQCAADFAMFDLTDHPEHARAAEVERLIHELICTPVHVAAGPLLGLRLMKIGGDEHVLAVAMEHIISDGFSLNLFFRDLRMLYLQALGRAVASLSAIPIQLPDYAVWQRKSHSQWQQVHGRYWEHRLAGCERVRFPCDVISPDPNTPGYAAVPVQIGADVKQALMQWCRARGTTLVLAMFTAFSASILRWCRRSDAVIRYQTDGRVTPLIEHSIGYFAAVLNLRIELHSADTWLDLLKRVTQEYCAACEHADASLIDSQVPRPGYTRNSGFNWVPCPPPLLPGAADVQEELRFRPWAFERPKLQGYEWEDEPSIILFEQQEGIEGSLFFAPKRVSAAAMERFRDDLLQALSALPARADQKIVATD